MTLIVYLPKLDLTWRKSLSLIVDKIIIFRSIPSAGSWPLWEMKKRWTKCTEATYRSRERWNENGIYADDYNTKDESTHRRYINVLSADRTALMKRVVIYLFFLPPNTIIIKFAFRLDEHTPQQPRLLFVWCKLLGFAQVLVLPLCDV